ncbi:MAG: hypothetical protein PWP15_482 [Methanothermococcus sp.]|nr:hypothetical protein [Methanothermococcus sp.]MDK2986878.1 hypothetical protein [Methanothermococcus sp.]
MIICCGEIMNVEILKQKILYKISEDELKKRIDEKIMDNSGLLNEEGALILISQELGIDVTYDDEDDEDEYEFTIKDIEEGQRNVEVTGKIIRTSEIRKFRRKDGSEGKMASIVIADNTGSIRLTLWNDKIDLIAGLKKGDVVKIENAFSRTWNNRLELNSGSDLKIEKLETYDESKYPVLKESYKILELVPNLSATIKGEVVASYEKKEFNKRDGSLGKLKSFILKDDSGSIRVTLWDDLADYEVNTGDKVELEGYVKQGFRGLEISANKINILEKGSPKEALEVTDVDISNVPNYEEKLVNVKGRITNISGIRNVEFKDRSAELQEIYLTDSTGRLKVSFWGNNIKLLEDLNEGDTVKITNCKVRTYLDREGNKKADLTVTYQSKIIKDENIDAPEYEKKIYKIKDIIDGNVNEIDKNNITTIGRVYRVFDIREFEREGGTSIGKVRGIVIEDETGRIRVSLWDKDAELDIKEGDIVKIVNGYVKENGEYLDLNIGRMGRIIINPKDVELKSVRKFIADLEEGDAVEIRGTIVDYRKQELILYLCPNCRKRTVLIEGEYHCNECGEVKPDEVLVSTLVVDDGTGNISCRLYGNNVEKITGMTKEDLKDTNLEILDNLIGEEFVFYGTSTIRNDELEFSVKGVSKVDLDREIELLKDF